MIMQNALRLLKKMD